MVGQLSGKAGNTVASRNRNGSYIRTRVVPALVRNAYTTAVRADFATIAQAWRGLTDAQRNGWTGLGANISRQNSIGQTYTLTGLQAFESVNRNLLTVGAPIVSVAPAFTPPSPLTSMTLTATSA